MAHTLLIELNGNQRLISNVAEKKEIRIQRHANLYYVAKSPRFHTIARKMNLGKEDLAKGVVVEPSFPAS